ncbi:conserved hypothetical protein, secreted [Candidatus Magnetobacterium bavaricum]|uniref:Alginate export domain-containing protein n=1 Tax=Candidatus Magnetobacterium bavaricum TaxID=29290 RepID=A0A0F3GTE7_9BACT|nr:conserved hypothetical protein, secreted [Candidatus Magnetobacterium bavaricum]
MMLLMFVLGTVSVVCAADEVSGTTVFLSDADAKITFGGEIRFRGWFLHNTKDQLDGRDYKVGMKKVDDDHITFYDSHVKLRVDARLGREVEGFLELDSGTDNVENWKWGSASTATGIYPNGNAKAGVLTIRQAWLLYTKDIYGIKVGHQLWVIGDKLFFRHSKFGDDGIRVIIKPSKEVNIEVSTIKLSEQGLNHPDDGDGYFVELKYNREGLKVGADVAYINDQGFSVLFPAYSHAHVWNFGLRADYVVGAATFRGDIEFQAGKLDGIGGVDDATVKGWAGLAGIDYKLGGGVPVVLTLETAYGSGKSKEDKSSDFKTFITSLGTEPNYTFVYDYLLKTAAGSICTGIANTFYIKGGANANLAKDLDGQLYVYSLQAAKKVALNGGDPSKNLGVEIDSRITYRLSKNLVYYVEGGYMFVGKAYDTVTSVSPERETQRSDAYALRNRLQLNF